MYIHKFQQLLQKLAVIIVIVRCQKHTKNFKAHFLKMAKMYIFVLPGLELSRSHLRPWPLVPSDLALMPYTSMVLFSIVALDALLLAVAFKMSAPQNLYSSPVYF